MTTLAPERGSPGVPGSLAAATTESPGGSAADPTARQRWRRWRVIVAVALVVVLAGVIVALVTSQGHGDDLDPRSYQPSGTHALAALLADRGVRVDTQTTVDGALSQAGAGDTLVVVNPYRLDDAALGRLAGTRADLVVVGATSFELEGLRLSIEPAGGGDETTVEPQCDLPAAATAGKAVVGGEAYRAPDGGVGCYPLADGYAVVTAPRDGRQVTLIGGGGFLTNNELAEQGNAALAIGLLDANPRVVWLVAPLVGPASASDQTSLTDLLPSRLKWAVLQLAIAVAVLAIWRGRRLGRLVPEALPVIVRQAETVVGRARLYRRARSADRAAAALRAGARDRLARRLGFGLGFGLGSASAVGASAGGAQAVGAQAEPLVDAIATRTGREARRVHGLLYGPTPADDHALVALAQELAALEQEVLRT